MKKKILCLLLVLAMMLSFAVMLASCGENDGPGETPRDENEFNENDKKVSKYYEYTWDTTQIKVELSDSSNNEMLVSRVKRYLSGEDDNNDDNIDELVEYRNGQAEKVTRTDIKYMYLEDIPNNRWGQSVARIAREAQSYSATSADIYVNFVYDIVAASLNGAFANLRSTKMPGSEGKNYFEFCYDDYKPGVDDEGYMYEYMESLSFSVKKMYILASDYFVDVVRAFFGVPVNLAMINSIDPYVVSDYNYDGDDKFDVDDFFNIIWKNEWNYEAVKTLSAAVAKVVGDVPNIMKDTYGFVVGTDDHNGLLYSSEIEIIARDLNPITGLYEITYPPSHDAYYVFCDAVADLFQSEGTGVMTRGDDKTVATSNQTYIRQIFKENRCLLGGVTMVGNLEHTDYQQMVAEGSGFGVAPTPMYREYNAEIDTDKNGKNVYHHTATHNNAKLAAISVATPNFKQCVAWLDYQSTHSTEILNEYYETVLMYQIAGKNPNNIKVLKMLRDNARTAMDKAYDDAIYGIELVPNNKDTNTLFSKMIWYGMGPDQRYVLLDSRIKYTNAIIVKAEALQGIYTKYQNLPE